MNKENPALLQGYVSSVSCEVSRPINGARLICFFAALTQCLICILSWGQRSELIYYGKTHITINWPRNLMKPNETHSWSKIGLFLFILPPGIFLSLKNTTGFHMIQILMIFRLLRGPSTIRSNCMAPRRSFTNLGHLCFARHKCALSIRNSQRTTWAPNMS